MHSPPILLNLYFLHSSIFVHSLFLPLPSSLPPPPLQTAKPHTITAALPAMVQVRPRRQVQYNTGELGINAPRDEIVEKRAPFALYHINRKLTHEPKV